MNTCKRCGKQKPDHEMDTGREGRPNRSTCKSCRYKMQAAWKRNHPKVRLVNFARHRAKIGNLPFNITASDFEIPIFCPAIGIRLELGNGKLHDASPTLERIVPELGYVKGNIAVISYKANRMKNNSSLIELENLTEWLRVQTIPREGRITAEPVTTNTPDNHNRLKIESELAGNGKRVAMVTLPTAA
jgi:hypothetical protein